MIMIKGIRVTPYLNQQSGFYYENINYLIYFFEVSRLIIRFIHFP